MFRIQRSYLKKIPKLFIPRSQFSEILQQTGEQIKNAETVMKKKGINAMLDRLIEKYPLEEEQGELVPLEIKGTEITDDQLLSQVKGLLGQNDIILVLEKNYKDELEYNSEMLLTILDYYKVKDIAYVESNKSPLFAHILSEQAGSKLFPLMFIKGKFVGDIEQLVDMHNKGSLGKLFNFEYNIKI